MNAVTGLLSALPPQMRDPVLFAVPFFLLLLVLEWTAARKLERIEEDRPQSGSYERRDAWASITMGLVSVGTTAVWKFLALLGYAAVYAYLAPWHLPATAWYTWVIALLGVDLLFYTYHRIAHRGPVRARPDELVATGCERERGPPIEVVDRSPGVVGKALDQLRASSSTAGQELRHQALRHAEGLGRGGRVAAEVLGDHVAHDAAEPLVLIRAKRFRRHTSDGSDGAHSHRDAVP